MIGKDTAARKLIERIGELYGVNYDDKTLQNIKTILENHREIIFNKDVFDFSIAGCESIEKVMPYAYRSFISKEPVGTAVVNRLLMLILNDEKTQGILSNTLEAIRGFKADTQEKEKIPIGMLYFDILDRLYFSEPHPVESAVCKSLDIDSHVFQYRKEEAIMLFGIYFWHRCLDVWGNWHEKAGIIQKEEGREDLIEKYGFAF
nr:hypothetical protein [Clostridia bacterium]